MTGFAYIKTSSFGLIQTNLANTEETHNVSFALNLQTSKTSKNIPFKLTLHRLCNQQELFCSILKQVHLLKSMLLRRAKQCGMNKPFHCCLLSLVNKLIHHCKFPSNINHTRNSETANKRHPLTMENFLKRAQYCV